jgi:hypothetical protein
MKPPMLLPQACVNSALTAAAAANVFERESDLTWHADIYYRFSINVNESITPAAGVISPECPRGWTRSDNDLCSRPDPIVPDCDDCSAPRVGNPMFIGLQSLKQQVEVDYTNASGTLQFIRTYRSDLGLWTHNHQGFAIDFNNQAFERAREACIPGSGGANAGEPWCYPIVGRKLANDVGVRREPDFAGSGSSHQ